MKTRRNEIKEDGHFDRDQFIDRRIVIGLITDSDYTGKVLSLKNADPIRLLGSPSAKKLASWCVEHYQKYHKSPGNDIEGIFMEQTKYLSDGEAIDIEDILSGLSDEHEDRGSEAYLFDQTVEYLRVRQMELLKVDIEKALEQNNLDTCYKLQSTFKPIQIEPDEKEYNTGKEIYNMEIEPVKWLIKDLIPKGLTVFGGQSKIGKSYLTLNMSLHLAQNKYMFADQTMSAYKGAKGPVLYLALEDPKARMKSRMEKIDPDPDLKLLKWYFKVFWSFEKLYKGGLNDLEEWLKKSKRPKLIVIDVIAKVWDMRNNVGAGRWYNQEYAIFGPLADLAHKYDTSIIAITHTKKTKEADVFNEILGGAGTQGPADNLMVLSRGMESNQRILAIRGKDMDDKRLLFEVFNEGADWQCEGEVDEVQKTNERQAIVDYLGMEGSMSLKDIQQAAKDGEIEASPNSVNTMLRKMVKDGTLVQPTYGKYSVPGKTNEMIRIKHTGKRLVE